MERGAATSKVNNFPQRVSITSFKMFIIWIESARGCDPHLELQFIGAVEGYGANLRKEFKQNNCFISEVFGDTSFLLLPL